MGKRTDGMRTRKVVLLGPLGLDLVRNPVFALPAVDARPDPGVIEDGVSMHCVLFVTSGRVAGDALVRGCGVRGPGDLDEVGSRALELGRGSEGQATAYDEGQQASLGEAWHGGCGRGRGGSRRGLVAEDVAHGEWPGDGNL